MPSSSTKGLLTIKLLVWLYVVLWLVEGALRKWYLPSLSNPLLVVRDPVVLAIYLLAAQRGLFPDNPILRFNLVLALITGALAMVAGHGSLYVMLFGLRTNYLHLPLIFLIPKVFTIRDVRHMGWLFLLAALPMSMIMVWQFRSPLDSWANAVAGGKLGGLLSAVGDKARVSGTFSFSSGPIYFYALITAFVLHSQLQKRSFPIWVVLPVAIALPVAAAVSGSRSLVAQSGIVVVFCCLGLLFKPQLSVRLLRLALVGAIAVFIVSGMAIYREGAANLMERFATADGEGGGGAAAFFGRFFGSMITPLQQLVNSRLLGEGLGLGTNAGGALGGVGGFSLGEDEWSRDIGELGIVLGPAFIIMRVWIFLTLFQTAFGAVRKGNLLPLLLLGTCGTTIINGQIGQPTTLGFACFAGGLCLAAAVPEAVRKAMLPSPVSSVPKPSGSPVPVGLPAPQLPSAPLAAPIAPGPARSPGPWRPPRPAPWRPPAIQPRRVAKAVRPPPVRFEPGKFTARPGPEEKS